MSTQRQASPQLPDPKPDIVLTKLIDEPTKQLDTANNMKATYQLPKDLELSTTCLPMTSESTKTLQAEEDGKPAITLTTYKHDYIPHDEAASLLHLFKPIDVNEVKNRTTPFFRTVTKQEQGTCSLMQLRLQLEEHFEGLKREFEVKREKSWTPLGPWAKAEWNWDWEDRGAEKEGALDWC
jgi:hypothetical protein